MSLQKQNTIINFAQGLDLKTDKWQVAMGKFLRLVNSVFDKGGQLRKRNGFQELAALPDLTSVYVTTLNGNLTALGTSIQAYNAGSKQWVSKGKIQPLKLATLPLIRNSINQTQCDTALAPNGLICTVYSEVNAGATAYKYAIADSSTGQNIIEPTAIPVTSGAVSGSPRVFTLGQYFIVAFTNTITATAHVQYIAISLTNPSTVTTAADLVSAYDAATTVAWDGAVFNNTLYFAYNTSAGGQAVEINSLSAGLSLAVPTSYAGAIGTMFSVCADQSNTIFAAFYNPGTNAGKIIAVDVHLNPISGYATPVSWTTESGVLNIAAAASLSACTIFYERSHTYSYDSNVATNFIRSVKVSGGNTSLRHDIVRGVGLASKAFRVGPVIGGKYYFLAAYQNVSSSTYQNNGNYQPTYFLINGSDSTSASPVVAAKLAYGNGGGYLTKGLPSVTLVGSTAYVAYLVKDLLSAVNKGTALVSGTQVAGIYTQTGINLCSLEIGAGANAVEIASNLHYAGGFLSNYDSYLPVEHNFFLYPDNIEATWSATGGSMAAKPDGSTNADAYWYQVTYEWSDNQGNIYRSAPSIPISVTTSGSGTAGSVALDVPTLRLTYKVPNPVKIVIYRWSVAQQTYYQVTSLTSALLNDTTADSVAFTDTLADATILGNNIIYTNGGVVEDVAAPATNNLTLFDTRLWMIDAEDPNRLWFSKQVIENTPVEMSDLFTFYVAPSTAAQGPTGPMKCLAPLDDKLIIFKKNAIYYINGTGPDNTGNNNQYSQPIFITSTVGCENQNSIVFMPEGLMFQSDKGIWLLNRGLTTSYIGADVEDFNSSVVQSAVNIPAENQVRFTLDTGETLLYDYFYGQWGTFEGVPAVSSCIYQGQHTVLQSTGEVFQENPGSYLDGSRPVLMSFTTGWLSLAGLQGYQRAYWFFLLGQYLSPHKIQLGVAYDYNPSIAQSTLITPTNYSSPTPSPFGAPTPFGSAGDVESWRVFLAQQRCTSFQLTLQEVYDPSQGSPAGAGFTLSGLNLIYAAKKGWKTISSGNSAGGGQNRG